MANANSTRAAKVADDTARPEQIRPTPLHEVEFADATGQHEADDSELRLNDRPKRIVEDGVTVSSAVFVLNKVYNSACGIAAITQILNNDNTARACAEPYLSNYLVGGLLTAANVLAENIEDSISLLADSAEKRSQGDSHVQ